MMEEGVREKEGEEGRRRNGVRNEEGRSGRSRVRME